MRIVIDLQGAQGTNRNRGIGRYSHSLTRAILENRGEHEVLLVLNGHFQDTIEPIRADFFDLLPQENIRVWYPPSVNNNLDEGSPDWRRQTGELVREAFLAHLKPDVVLVTSMFEGQVDGAVTSIGQLNGSVPTAVILYDLIPLIFSDLYLQSAEVKSWYETKLEYVRRADLLLAISESTRQDGMRYLGFSGETITNISTAADPQFCPQTYSPEDENAIRSKYKIDLPFVMYTGGIDPRKNIEGLIRAYAKVPRKIRKRHQLVLVCSIQAPDQARLEDLAKKHGLKNKEIIFTGYVSEEDLLLLYAMCKLFIFPSIYEGFGLPVLEAMSCGRAVVGANTSSLPEVIGREDILFDPRSDEAITEKLIEVLVNDAFRLEIEQHGLKVSQKFSWDDTALRALNALEKFHSGQKRSETAVRVPERKPKMAYISPLPPERSGISDYSAELLPALSRFYEIDVVSTLDAVADHWINGNCKVRNVEWFRAHSDQYDRVLFHFGNSDFHTHMFSLLEDVPGVVVLHDFFLSGIVAHIENTGQKPDFWVHELYRSHGYDAVFEYLKLAGSAEVVWKYPCNLGVLRDSIGIIFHSDYARKLAKQWYPSSEPENWAKIPLLRTPTNAKNRTKVRKELGVQPDDFVVCSFGMLGPTKLNHRLLEAWLASDLSKDKKCILVFIGEKPNREYDQKLLATIKRSRLSNRIRITGWVDLETFKRYLAVADVCVQLRSLSRGETSAAVLDCMNHALPTVVNANGSMADLDGEAVWKLDDEFSDDELVEALEALWRDASLREKLGKRAKEVIRRDHFPAHCAALYFSVIEGFYKNSVADIQPLAHSLAHVKPAPRYVDAMVSLAEAVTKSIPPKFAVRQLLVDVSELVQRDWKTGIQRVVRNVLREWLTCPPDFLRVEPVYATTDQGYRYARRFTLDFLGLPAADSWRDEPVEYQAGDIFLGLDLQPHVVSAQQDFYQQMRHHGVDVRFVVYDLLCCLLPRRFVPGAAENHARWLKVVSESDGAICISNAVANELAVWVKENGPKRLRPFRIDWFHLGVDAHVSMLKRDLSIDAASIVGKLEARPSFLMVGTVEPRKGHAQTLEAFEYLWQNGLDVNLVIVGKQGWMVEAFVDRLRQHPESGKRLFWLEGISDEYLEKIYSCSACLIAASEGEGFGLPLIEAAQHGLPIIARDIPVFREVTGGNALFFEDAVEPEVISEVVMSWIDLFNEGSHPGSEGISWFSWKESSQALMAIVLSK